MGTHVGCLVACGLALLLALAAAESQWYEDSAHGDSTATVQSSSKLHRQVVDIFVDPSPTGRNLEAALATVAQHVQSSVGSGRRMDVTVHLRPGIHVVPRGGLQIAAAHSPERGSVRWVGENASVSSEQPVAGWRRATEESMAAQGAFFARIPPGSTISTVRHLWVNGRRASRTRRLVERVLPGLKLGNDSQGYTVAANDSLRPPPTNWSNPSDVEFVYSGVAQSWSEARCAVADIRLTVATSGRHDVVVNMKQPCFWNLVHRMYQPVADLPPIYVDNVKEHMSSCGEFYFDSARQSIYYIPHPHEDMETARVVVALEEQLVRVQNASHQTFEGITFEYATWLRPGQPEGYVEQQSGACDDCEVGTPISGKTGGGAFCGKNDTYRITPANVAVLSSHDITFVNSKFQHLGAYAAGARDGSRNVIWRGCNFDDISSGALTLGDVTTADELDERSWDQNFQIVDCQILGTGKEYTGASGLFAGYVGNMTIAHNLFKNQTYTAIAIGWGWGREAARGRGGNRVIANRIETPLQVRCCDGGAIYTLGPQPGSIIQGNYIYQQLDHSGRWPAGEQWRHGACVYHGESSLCADLPSAAIDVNRYRITYLRHTFDQVAPLTQSDVLR